VFGIDAFAALARSSRVPAIADKRARDINQQDLKTLFFFYGVNRKNRKLLPAAPQADWHKQAPKRYRRMYKFNPD